MAPDRTNFPHISPSANFGRPFLLMEMVANDYAAQGIVIGEVTVSAIDSWMQFAKNSPTALIVFFIMLSGIYTSEYTKGTLIPLLTKGLSRTSVVLSKFSVMLLIWSAGFFLCFGVTYFYSDFYWDNSTVNAIFPAAFFLWLFGVLIISCIVFFSSLASSAPQVMLGTGAVYLLMTFAGMYKKAAEYLPTRLCASTSLYSGELVPSDFTTAAIITAVLSVILVLAALPLTQRRQL